MDFGSLDGLDRAQLAALIVAATERLAVAPEPEPKAEDDDPLWRTAKAAKRLVLEPRTVTRLAREGRIVGAQQVGTRSWRFDPEVLAVRVPELAPPPPPPSPRASRSPRHAAAPSRSRTGSHREQVLAAFGG